MIPINTRTHTFGTVPFWKGAARHFGARTWKGAMDKFALQHGKAIAMLANDGARIVERVTRPNGQQCLIRHELGADSVAWHNGDYRHA